MSITETKHGSISQSRLGFTIIIAVLLIGLIVVLLDWREVRKVLGETNWKIVPFAFVFTLTSYTCISLGFVVVNELFGIRIRRRDLAEIGFVSTVLNNVISAGGMAGLSVRYLMIHNKEIELKDIVAASFFQSYFTSLGMLVLLPVGLIHLFLNHPLAQGTSIGVIASAVLIFVLFFIATAAVFLPTMRNRLFHILGGLAGKIAHRNISTTLDEFSATMTRGVMGLRANRGKFILLLCLVFGDWVSSITALWICFYAMGSLLNIGVLLTGFTIGITAGVLSMLPGGVGVQEGSMAGIYAMLGTPLSTAVLAAILFRLVYYLIPYLLSLGFYNHLLRRMKHETASTMDDGVTR